MDVVVVWSKIKSNQVLVRDQKDAILTEPVAIVLGQVTRVEQLFVLVEGLPHIQRLLIDAKCVEARDFFHFYFKKRVHKMYK